MSAGGCARGREEGMGAWRLVGDVAGLVAACAVLAVLVWGAIDRGRVHRLVARDPELRKEAEDLLARGSEGRGRFGRPGAARHGWRDHLTAWAVLRWK